MLDNLDFIFGNMINLKKKFNCLLTHYDNFISFAAKLLNDNFLNVRRFSYNCMKCYNQRNFNTAYERENIDTALAAEYSKLVFKNTGICPVVVYKFSSTYVISLAVLINNERNFRRIFIIMLPV